MKVQDTLSSPGHRALLPPSSRGLTHLWAQSSATVGTCKVTVASEVTLTVSLLSEGCC